MAARARARAAHAPQASRIAQMAMTPGADMTSDEIRQLATDAIDQAQQINYYLGLLAGLLGTDDSAGGTGA
jgi:hypothetical protein